MADSNREPRSSKEYWEDRALKLERRANQKARDITAKTRKHYQKAAAEIEKQVAVFYSRYAGEQGVSYAEAVKTLNSKEAKEWRKSLGEYVEEINSLPEGPIKDKLKAELDARAYASRITRLDALKGQLDLAIDRLMVQTVQGLHDGLGALYEDSYYRKLFDLEQRSGKMFDFAHLNANMVEEVLRYPWSGADFSARLWENKRSLLFHTREILTQSMIQGKSVVDTSKELADTMNKSYGAAERLIRTEANHLHNEADKTAYNVAGVDDYDFLAFIDSRTSKICKSLDGKTFPVSKAKAGTNYPPMHPNCRSTTVEHEPVDWESYVPENDPTEKEYDEWAAERGIELPGVLKDTGKGGKIKLSESQEYAIDRYIGADSYILNAKLREGVPLTDDEIAWIYDLDSALEQFPQFQGKLFRTLVFDDKEEIQSFRNRYLINSEVSERAYTSASTLHDYHEQPSARMIIHSKTGRDLREINASEQEVLFPRGTTFLVKNKRIVNGVIEIEVEEINE